MKKLAVLLFTLGTLVAPGFATAAGDPNAELASFRAAIKAGLRQVYVEQLKLTDAEGKAFWPAYDQYEKDIKANNDKLLELIKRYAAAYNAGPVDAATAGSLLKDAMAIDKAEYQIHEAMVKKAMKALPANKAALFYQIDNKVRATFKYDLASQIPLVE